MKRFPFALLMMTVFFVLLFCAASLADIKYEADPRGKIEQLTGEGEYVPVNEDGSKWNFKGADQDWEFTRTTQLKDGGEFTIKRERFWIAIRRVDGVWVTRTTYRFKELKSGESEAYEVTEKDKSGKFAANCRIYKDKIILSLTRKKQGAIFRITRSGEFIQVNHIALPGLEDSTQRFKRR